MKTIDTILDKKEFMRLPVDAVHEIVQREKKSLTGIFSSDGNRRLVMALTGLTPKDPSFYRQYLRIVTTYFMLTLDIFFDHGVRTLFFPLFGPSLLKREEAYKQTVLPGLIRLLFQDESWLKFYKRKGIRVKTYGTPGILDNTFQGLDLTSQINRTVERTTNNKEYTLYYGFFSTPWPIAEIIRKKQATGTLFENEPDQAELIELYYGENIQAADFFITSLRTAGLGALPPFIAGKETHVYTTAAPGIFAINKKTFRKILYDLIYCDTGSNTVEIFPQDKETLEKFFTSHRYTISGTRKKKGNSWVPDV